MAADESSRILLFLLLLNLLNLIKGDEQLDMIYLEKRNFENTNDKIIPVEFMAFGQSIELKLRRNDRLLSPYFKVWLHRDSSNNAEQLLETSTEAQNNYYLHQDDVITAAVSFTHQGLHGLVMLENMTLEISPLIEEKENDNIKSFINKNLKNGMPHVVKRAQIPKKYSNNTYHRLKLHNESTDDELTIELAVFFDEPGHNIFSPFFNGNEIEIRNMLLAYINAIQALYYHPSLGTRINIVLVRLDIMKQQPKTLPHYNGERNLLLNSFCNFTTINNPPDDNHPDHWDLGLYVSGLDFYVNENGRKNGVTMGLATVSGVCLQEYSCVIAELGVTNRFGKPYPSAGFTSVYIAAHEIGHNLGMHHDSTGNSCPQEGYIMSPSRGTQGETIWSPCSSQVALALSTKKPCLLDKTVEEKDKELDHTYYLTLPGRKWTAKRQCELLLRDKDASVVSLVNACQALQCRSPHRSGLFYSGPALDGTTCENEKECRGGECLPALHFLGNPSSIEINHWSKWNEGPCTSGCIEKSTGTKSRNRVCNYHERVNNCEGMSYETMLCSDDKICKKRITPDEFATIQCEIFGNYLPELDDNSSGLQAPHESQRLWMACAIFCRRKDIASYYTPRVELNDLGLDPYFPDGTWCHRDENNNDYYCHRHHCLPENFDFIKNSWISNDFIFSTQNEGIFIF